MSVACDGGGWRRRGWRGRGWVKSVIITWLGVAAVMGALGGCGEGRMPGGTANEDRVPDAVWERLAQRRILFGHKSVGANILAGVRELQGAGSRQIRIAEIAAGDRTDGPALYHFLAGENGNPESKLRALSVALDGAEGEVDVAVLKFCYVDVTGATDVNALFEAYRGSLVALEQRYPTVKFVHVTVPLTRNTGGLRGIVRAWMGKPEHNMNRSRFNRLLEAEYGPGNRLFDLAQIESTRPDGGRNLFSRAGGVYPVLVPEYTDDGGHLNARGRAVVARAFLQFLASLDAGTGPRPGAGR